MLDAQFSFGDKVILKTFNGTATSLAETKPTEDYWKLIGTQGVVQQTWEQANFDMKQPRFLVKFDTDVNRLGLDCHNEIPNSLWILGSDIEPI